MYEERPSRLAGAVAWRRRTTTGGVPLRILPDGCLDLIWIGGSLLVAGPDTEAYLVSSPAGRCSVGLRFGPGTGPAVLGVPAYELRDQRVPLADLWPAAEVERLTSAVAGAVDPGAALEAIALSRRPRFDPLLTEIAARLRAGASVAATSARVGLGERQLHRRCLAGFGYGPKTLARILRLDRALRLAHRGTPFAAVAAETGYADQAHLSRDVRALAGVPLGVLTAA